MPETSQEQLVETGLEAVAEATQPKSDPINFEEPISAADLTAGVADKPEDATPVVSVEQLRALQNEAERDNTKRDFTIKVLAARQKNDEPEQPPPPLAPRIAEQTNAEIAAGRKMNAHHAALQVHRPKVEPELDKHQAVFRPGDYVPDAKKGQGYVQSRNL